MKSYFRFLSRNKLYTLINVVGLVVSLMFIILLGDYTWRQYSIDSWHKHADRIVLMGDQTSFSMWPQAGDWIKDMCPEIEQKCCVMSVRGKIKYGRQEVKDGENENGIIMVADSTFFQFFDFELETGSRQTALNSPDKCVITERLAHRLFGDKNPIGESVQIVGEYDVEPGNTVYDSTLVYTVSAVAKDFDHTVLPNETQIIANMKRYPQMLGSEFPGYSYAFSNAGACKVFFMLRPGMTLDNKKKTIDNYIVNNYFIPFGEYKVSVTPLKEVMFAPQNDGKGLQKGDKTRLHILITAVLALLFFAITNYINLTVANTGFRSKEMATRRLFGSSQRMIAWKLIAESALMVALAFAIGLALALCFQDDAISLFKGKIAITDDINIVSVSLCLGGIFLVGIVSGLLPSWQMTRYQPIDIVKGNFRFRSKMVLGKVFIILQNVITVTMLTASLVIWLQLHHLIHAPLGFNTEHLFYIISPEGKEQVVRSKLEKMPFVEKIGTFNGCTFTQFHTGLYIIVRDDKFVSLFETDMDKTTFELLGLQIKHNHGTSNDGIYLNEEALRQLDNKIDARELGWYDGGKEPVAGVLEEFHSVNVLSPIQPFAIRVQKDKEFPMFLVKTNGDKQAKAAFDEMMKKLNESAEDRVQSIEESIAETFKDQQHTLKLITLFTLIAIVVSVLGFIGMSLFFIRQRQKDIGIRKIMGSTSHEVMMLMLRTFCAPLLVSFVIAIPLSWYVMNDWLSNFSYRISLSPWIFAVTCAFALLVAVLSVSIQIIKAVRTNPVESIKTE
jgi:putative ABC transport system permease protein